MPKRKKHPRLPNAFGSIRYIGKGRTNPYAVHPPVTETNEAGDYVRPKALCYVDDWYVGFAVLNAYHAGTYKQGDELLFKTYRSCSGTDLDAFCARLLADHTAQAYVAKESEGATFKEVYEAFYEWKFGENAPKKLSSQAKDSARAAYKHFEKIHGKVFKDLQHDDFQDCITNCPRKSSTKENMVSLVKQMTKYALLYNHAEVDRSTALYSFECDDESGVPFTEDEMRTLIQYKDDPIVEFILIMCLSGYRITAYVDIEVNTDKWYFFGGIKTAAGKERIVPIHPFIQSMVEKRMRRIGGMLDVTPAAFRRQMYKKLSEIGIEKHTPHDCRHTFSALLESAKVNENDRKRMMGHSFGNDITNKIYGHRTLEELRVEIEKIKM